MAETKLEPTDTPGVFLRNRMDTIYHFDALSERAKERARDWWRDNLEPSDYADHVIEEFETEIAPRLGISLKTHAVQLMNGKTRHDPNVWWELHTQGAGACFEGSYAYKAGSVKAIKDFAPEDRALHSIAEALATIQRKHGYSLGAVITQRGNSLHPQIDVEKTRGEWNADSDAWHEAQIAVCDALRDLMKWIYRQLDAEFDYQSSDEAVDENLRANEYEFDEDGRRA